MTFWKIPELIVKLLPFLDIESTVCLATCTLKQMPNEANMINLNKISPPSYKGKCLIVLGSCAICENKAFCSTKNLAPPFKLKCNTK